MTRPAKVAYVKGLLFRADSSGLDVDALAEQAALRVLCPNRTADEVDSALQWVANLAKASGRFSARRNTPGMRQTMKQKEGETEQVEGKKEQDARQARERWAAALLAVAPYFDHCNSPLDLNRLLSPSLACLQYTAMELGERLAKHVRTQRSCGFLPAAAAVSGRVRNAICLAALKKPIFEKVQRAVADATPVGHTGRNKVPRAFHRLDCLPITSATAVDGPVRQLVRADLAHVRATMDDLAAWMGLASIPVHVEEAEEAEKAEEAGAEAGAAAQPLTVIICPSVIVARGIRTASALRYATWADTRVRSGGSSAPVVPPLADLIAQAHEDLVGTKLAGALVLAVIHLLTGKSLKVHASELRSASMGPQFVCRHLVSVTGRLFAFTAPTPGSAGADGRTPLRELLGKGASGDGVRRVALAGTSPVAGLLAFLLPGREHRIAGIDARICLTHFFGEAACKAAERSAPWEATFPFRANIIAMRLAQGLKKCVSDGDYIVPFGKISFKEAGIPVTKSGRPISAQAIAWAGSRGLPKLSRQRDAAEAYTERARRFTSEEDAARKGFVLVSSAQDLDRGRTGDSPMSKKGALKKVLSGVSAFSEAGQYVTAISGVLEAFRPECVLQAVYGFALRPVARCPSPAFACTHLLRSMTIARRGITHVTLCPVYGRDDDLFESNTTRPREPSDAGTRILYDLLLLLECHLEEPRTSSPFHVEVDQLGLYCPVAEPKLAETANGRREGTVRRRASAKDYHDDDDARGRDDPSSGASKRRCIE